MLAVVALLGGMFYGGVDFEKAWDYARGLDWAQAGEQALQQAKDWLVWLRSGDNV